MTGALSLFVSNLTVSFIAEPFITPGGQIAGMELLSRFQQAEGVFLPPPSVITRLSRCEKRYLLLRQTETLRGLADDFRQRKIFCTLNLDRDMMEIISAEAPLQSRLKNLPFVWAEIHEEAGHIREQDYRRLLRHLGMLFPLVMDDYGRGLADDDNLTSGLFRAVKIDRRVFCRHAAEQTLDRLVSHLKTVCPLVIAEGVETPPLKQAAVLSGVTAMQGRLFPSASPGEPWKYPQDSEWHGGR